jgi:hypothetical protein
VYPKVIIIRASSRMHLKLAADGKVKLILELD